MYSSSLDFWYKKGRKDSEKEGGNQVTTEKSYNSKDVKFAVRFCSIFGTFFGLYTGYLIWGM